MTKSKQKPWQKPKLAMLEKKSIVSTRQKYIHFFANFFGGRGKIVSNYYVLLLADLNHQSQTPVYKTEDVEYIHNRKDEDFAAEFASKYIKNLQNHITNPCISLFFVRSTFNKYFKIFFFQKSLQ